MTQLFSKSSEYAIQAMMYLSSRGASSPTLVKEISSALDIPHHYLAKVLQQLAKDDLLLSQRGMSGGFCLARSPAEITLQDIITSVEGPHAFERCLLGLPTCGPDAHCPIHERWSAVRTTVLTLLNESTLEQLGKEFETAVTTNPFKHDHAHDLPHRDGRND